MTQILLTPPIAFMIYLVLAGLLFGLGRVMAGPEQPTALKSTTYASGEAPPARSGIPGYSPFFVIALFFAVLHLGVLVLGTGEVAAASGIYLAGLALVLVVLILG